MGVADDMEILNYRTEQLSAEKEIAPACIARMSNPELLRFGVNAKLRCSQAESPDDPRIITLRLWLHLARVEWNRRHPKLPLRNSF
jgi:hypothetical protein